MREIFVLSRPRISENIPATSEDFRRFSEDSRTNVSENVWRRSDDLWTLPIRTDCDVWKRVVIQLGHKVNIKCLFRGNLIEFLLLSMCWRTNRPDLWVRREKLSLMREIDVFSPQDSYIMRESWQVYYMRRFHGIVSFIALRRNWN